MAFVATLCAVFGSIELATGVLSLVFLPVVVEETASDATSATWSSVLAILLGSGLLLASAGIYRGSVRARTVVLAVIIAHAAGGAWLAISGQPVQGLIAIGVALVVGVLLWTGRGAKYFRGDATPKRR
ncbi:hypothetical protein GCM10027413_23410 [Conyzicola nivalis]|uniref:Uncharacterized protein n=1 Tax=Conyzicola nivalis TaxID=1477021 RepID=A0A916SAX4_9MICO|nr:hypothetical protein GCM10010979_03210 [Conyzicola nivalis]